MDFAICHEWYFSAAPERPCAFSTFPFVQRGVFHVAVLVPAGESFGFQQFAAFQLRTASFLLFGSTIEGAVAAVEEFLSAYSRRSLTKRQVAGRLRVLDHDGSCNAGIANAVRFVRRRRKRFLPHEPSLIVAPHEMWVRQAPEHVPIVEAKTSEFAKVARRWYWTGIGQDVARTLPVSAFRARRVAVAANAWRHGALSILSPFDVGMRWLGVHVSNKLANDTSVLRAACGPNSDIVCEEHRSPHHVRLVRAQEDATVAIDFRFDPVTMTTSIVALDGVSIVALTLQSTPRHLVLVSRERAAGVSPYVVIRPARRVTCGAVLRETERWLVLQAEEKVLPPGERWY